MGQSCIIFQVHVAENSTFADHCRHYAPSQGEDDNYLSRCDQQQHERCDIFPAVISEIQAAIDGIDESAEKKWVEVSTGAIKTKDHVMESTYVTLN